MRTILTALCLCLLSGALTAEEFTIRKVEVFTINKIEPAKIEVKPAAQSPTTGRHKTVVCEEHGCGCGCLRDGACLCHPGWEKSDGDWYFYRQRGVETAAFNSRTNTYYRKDASGKWQEWKETTSAVRTIQRSNARIGRSC